MAESGARASSPAGEEELAVSAASGGARPRTGGRAAADAALPWEDETTVLATSGGAGPVEGERAAADAALPWMMLGAG